jgi:hypothetical protein
VKVIYLREVARLGRLQNWICRVAVAQERRGCEVQLMQPPWVAAQEDEV